MIETHNKRILNERLTLRIPSPLLNTLKKEADEKDLPVNALINRILTKSSLQDGKVNVMPSISMSQMLFEKIVNELDGPALEKAAKIGSNVIKKFFTLQNQKMTLDNIISDYFVVLSKYCGWFSFHNEKIGEKYRLVFESHFDSKWAQFLFHYVKSILVLVKVFIEKESIDDNIVVFEISKK